MLVEILSSQSRERERRATRKQAPQAPTRDPDRQLTLAIPRPHRTRFMLGCDGPVFVAFAFFFMFVFCRNLS